MWTEVTMATAAACAALVSVLPHLVRARRGLTGAAPLPTTSALAVVHEHGSLRATEVADRLGLDLSTVSRHLAHLRADGLLETSPDPDDGRSQRLRVTAAGAEELRTRRERVVQALVQRLADWDDAEIDHLTRLLQKLAGTPTGATAGTTTEEKTVQGNA
ncbi:MarR family winged helix-turn-helix transcriptional regulator [Kineococcus gypseus]|uniref:MarR family winged helix-turn-helix transcriptional regulator n=1 Tax=Kineococcus gypseus TaxID=1637102 RepID=UPI003D7D78A8